MKNFAIDSQVTAVLCYSTVLCYFRLTMLTIGLSGATCSGKSSSSVASMLEKVLTSCMVINQDKSMENERLMKIIVEKENIIREGSKVERLYMHKVKNQILLGK